MRMVFPVTFETDQHKPDELSEYVTAILAAHGLKAEIGDPQVVDASAEEAFSGTVTAYTDGGCDARRNGVGAWAFYISDTNGHTEQQSGAFVGTTNNRMEMMAVIKVLERIPLGSKIRIFSDSKYVIDGLTSWCRNWVRNGWKTRDGKDVLNRDLWEKMIDLYRLHDVMLLHVKGHSGVYGNELVDSLCTEAMVQAHKDLLSGDDVQVDENAPCRA